MAGQLPLSTSDLMALDPFTKMVPRTSCSLRDPNGSSPDLIINVDPTYLSTLWLDPNSAPPSTMTDGLSVFLHEIGHGLGIQGYRNSRRTSCLRNALGSASRRWCRYASFIGYYAEAIYGGPVSVTTLQNGQQYNHLGNDVSERNGQDLMNGVVFYYGTRHGYPTLTSQFLKTWG